MDFVRNLTFLNIKQKNCDSPQQKDCVNKGFGFCKKGSVYHSPIYLEDLKMIGYAGNVSPECALRKRQNASQSCSKTHRKYFESKV